MELIKLYRGLNGHTHALYKDYDDRYYTSESRPGMPRKWMTHNCNLEILLDRLEYLSLYAVPVCEPVALFYTKFNGVCQRFETVDELIQYYTDPDHNHDLHESEIKAIADCLKQGLPAICGQLTAYREKASRFTQGLTAQRPDYHKRIRELKYSPVSG